jgi:16S rRNA C967 or C1407 C5-methylase (RsmB/RsmF family)
LESQRKRLESLQNNLERLGVRNVIVYNDDARKFEGEFDKILVDAPCSGNLITDWNWLRKKTVDSFEQIGELQKDILDNMVNNLNEGGELVYSTCSLEPEENEMVIQWALENLDVKLVKIDCPGSPGLTNVFGEELDKDIAKCRRLWPNKTDTQGFFIAKFRRC